MHYLLLLRPLMVLISVVPLMALAVLTGWYQERRRKRRGTRTSETGNVMAESVRHSPLAQ